MSSCDWASEQSLEDTLSVLRDIATVLSSRTGPYRAPLVDLLERGDFMGLARFDDWLYASSPEVPVHNHLAARQVVALFSKLGPLGDPAEKERLAYGKFIEAEAQCRASNEFFHLLSSGRVSAHPDVMRQLLAARRKIRRILGSCPSLSDLALRFGPGATVDIRKTEAFPTAKFAAGIGCSEDVLASGLLPGALREVPHWTSAHDSLWSIDDDGFLVETVNVEVQVGKLVFVPKNAKIHRSVVVEPCLNTFFQAGIGDWMAGRLRSFGIDIRDQKRNQRAARSGSLDGGLATIDLSSASDTVSKGIVKFLLPPEWFRLLSAFRTSKVAYGDTIHDQAKFSSMGNGFTFPLETLIFHSLAASCPFGNEVLAYGDDIICRSDAYDDVVRLLEVCGFSVNLDKSYSEGPFRESCGADYYRGINIRPFYQRSLVSGRSLFLLHNFFRRNLDDEVADAILCHIPEPIRLWGPDGYGDGHLVGRPVALTRSRRLSRVGFGGYFFETYSSVPRSFRSPYPGDYVSPLYSVYARGVIPVPNEYFPSSSKAGFRADVCDFQGSIRSSDGRCYNDLPGVQGYKKMLIYTFSPT